MMHQSLRVSVLDTWIQTGSECFALNMTFRETI